MEKELVFGHTNPDTDAIGAAIAAADYFNNLNMNVEAVALGKPNAETQFALDYFKLDTPRIIDQADTKKVMLVDHNEAVQSVSNIDDLQVTHVIDHHKIDFKCSDPLFYHAEPVGATSTIIFNMYKNKNIDVPKNIAGIMMSAIISDTLLLKSPTTTNADREAIPELAKIAGVDNYEDYGLKFLKAGTDLSSRTDIDIIEGDAKTFEMNSKTFRIGQVNTVDVNDVLNRKDIKESMDKELKEKGYDDLLLVITNILTSNSKGIFYGSDSQAVEKAFNNKLIDNVIDLPGVVSRKKQIVPNLTKAMG